jgi:hypothetical protein
LELFIKKNIVIQGHTAIPEASSRDKRQIRPHHFCHSGLFSPHLNETESYNTKNKEKKRKQK